MKSLFDWRNVQWPLLPPRPPPGSFSWSTFFFNATSPDLVFLVFHCLLIFLPFSFLKFVFMSCYPPPSLIWFFVFSHYENKASKPRFLSSCKHKASALRMVVGIKKLPLFIHHRLPALFAFHWFPLKRYGGMWNAYQVGWSLNERMDSSTSWRMTFCCAIHKVLQ